MSRTVGAIGFSLLVHAVALGVLAFSFAQKPQPLAVQGARTQTVEAVAVDERRVEEELRRLKSSEQLQRETEQARQQRVEQELAQARKAKEEEDRRLAEVKQRREQEQREAEQQRKQLAELKLQQARLEKEKAELEKRRQEEQERLAAAEKKRKAEEASARKAEEDRKRREQIAAEEKRLAAERRQRLGRLVTQYEADIASKVQRNWLRPTGSAETFQCKVAVQQMPGGEVVSVQVVSSCGSAALDRSVEAAVRKASPLPAPPAPELFDNEIHFTFKPR